MSLEYTYHILKQRRRNETIYVGEDSDKYLVSCTWPRWIRQQKSLLQAFVHMR